MSEQFNWPIYGHKQQINFLQESLRQNQLANAYLFYGPKGLGKKLIVQYFAQSLWCQQANQRPCQQCLPCKLAKQGSYPDFYVLGKEQAELSADSIKEFLARLSLSGVMGGQKLAVIYQVDRMNLFAFNALLKMIEEPPQRTTIILIADQISNLPATIISRCQLLKFGPLNKVEMMDWLNNFGFSSTEKETIANLAFGKPGLALDFIEDNLKNFREKCDWLLKLLNSVDFTSLQSIDHWFAFLKKEYPDYKIYELGNLTVDHLNLLELMLRDLLWINLGRMPANSLYAEQLTRLSGRYSLPFLLKNLLMINNLRSKISKNISPQLLWENLILSLKS